MLLPLPFTPGRRPSPLPLKITESNPEEPFKTSERVSDQVEAPRRTQEPNTQIQSAYEYISRAVANFDLSTTEII